MLGGEAREPGPVLPAELVFLALELADLARAAREHQYRLAVPHQSPRHIRCADDGAVGGDQISLQTAHAGELSVGQRSDPNPEGFAHEVRDHGDLVAATGVVADQEEPAVAGEVRQSADVRPGQLQHGGEGVGGPVEHRT